MIIFLKKPGSEVGGLSGSTYGARVYDGSGAIDVVKLHIEYKLNKNTFPYHQHMKKQIPGNQS